jgi:hypothetical protein
MAVSAAQLTTSQLLIQAKHYHVQHVYFSNVDTTEQVKEMTNTGRRNSKETRDFSAAVLENPSASTDEHLKLRKKCNFRLGRGYLVHLVQ